MKQITILLFLIIFTISCNSNDNSITVEKEPTDELIASLGNEDYSIVLNDMDIRDQSGRKRFQHKYNILKVKNDSLIVDSLDWKTVNRNFFEKHENDLGMEIVSNHNNKLSRTAKPVGFGWAIGNNKYGEWEEVKKDTSSSNNTNHSRRRWRSSGSNHLFWYWMMRRSTYQNNYTDYKSANASGKSYYGQTVNGNTEYGTRSEYQKKKRASFFTRKNSSSTWNSFKNDKTKRSSSRYKSSSSTRSRSGGFGK